METILEQELNVNKSTWQKIKFGDVVNEPKESIKDPEAAGIRNVVGLEHIVSEDIHLRNSASIEEATTFTKNFKKGDVLFGRRRAYLKKAAQAPFNGICSGDITVFRAKENLLPELLPFIVNNDKFFDYAVKHSAGGLSPRVKFKDLANYEFLLPPKDQQAQLAELLWAMDEVIERGLITKDKLQINKEVLRKEYFQIKENSKTVKIGNIAKLTAGGTPSTSKTEYWENGEIPWLSSGEVHKKRVYNTEKLISRKGLQESSAKLLPVKTCLIALAGQGKTKGTVAISEIELTTNQSVAAIIPNKDMIEADYLYHNLDSRYLDFRHITGKENSRTGLNLRILKGFEIVYHLPNLRKSIIEKFNNIDKLIELSDDKILASKSLQKSLINQIF
ncbi:restriction endonuclease subunit S [Salegentibacter maritimus]|uniref:restriction endonuclease subunit S n=1 Tax=Salegentibacter maritimus TaxID=2794347 RepID=UPI0018E4D12D|nr:restriction endonuclease subunit S [Salegentibacter maritimus]MBI6117948.1 restriction endonuclease subunit S [Salegentibacter maritimus]